MEANGAAPVTLAADDLAERVHALVVRLRGDLGVVDRAEREEPSRGLERAPVRRPEPVGALPDLDAPAKAVAAATRTDGRATLHTHLHTEPGNSEKTRDNAGISGGLDSRDAIGAEAAETLASEATDDGVRDFAAAFPVVGRVGIEPTTSTL